MQKEHWVCVCVRRGGARVVIHEDASMRYYRRVFGVLLKGMHILSTLTFTTHYIKQARMTRFPVTTVDVIFVLFSRKQIVWTLLACSYSGCQLSTHFSKIVCTLCWCPRWICGQRRLGVAGWMGFVCKLYSPSTAVGPRCASSPRLAQRWSPRHCAGRWVLMLARAVLPACLFGERTGMV